ncbi:MAG: polyprenol monophosphomannose synthase [Candidatus Vogelbacteria bacterium]|nr:polyprenol monophosphomannose synthase [Candidatus Vogelbacteria bacterium]
MKNIVIVPTYNERDNIEKLCPEIFRLLPDISVLVVDDNSPDKTSDVVKNMQKKYPRLLLLERPGKEGLGRAYIDAFNFVLRDGTFDSLITMDADFSHDPKYLKPMLEESKNHDLVIGSRYINDGATEGWEFWRRMLSYWGNQYSRLVTSAPIHDCTGGFNLLKPRFLNRLDLSRFGASGYAFQIELKYKLWKAGAKVKEIPIVFRNRLEGESKISNHIIKEGILTPWRLVFKK